MFVIELTYANTFQGNAVQGYIGDVDGRGRGVVRGLAEAERFPTEADAAASCKRLPEGLTDLYCPDIVLIGQSPECEAREIAEARNEIANAGIDIAPAIAKVQAALAARKA